MSPTVKSLTLSILYGPHAAGYFENEKKFNKSDVHLKRRALSKKILNKINLCEVQLRILKFTIIMNRNSRSADLSSNFARYICFYTEKSSLSLESR